MPLHEAYGGLESRRERRAPSIGSQSAGALVMASTGQLAIRSPDDCDCGVSSLGSEASTDIDT